MSIITTFPLLLIMGFLFFVILRNRTSGKKLMLLGISIILVGGIFAVDGNTNLGGFEYLIVFIGLTLSVVGFSIKN